MASVPTFSNEFRECLKDGLRPKGDPRTGHKWTYTEFAKAVKKVPKTIENWIQNGKGPRELDVICRAFFGAVAQNEKGERQRRLENAHSQAWGKIEAKLVGAVSTATIALLNADDDSVHNWIDSRMLLTGSSEIDLWLYTSETVLGWLRTRLNECRARVRLLIRHAEGDNDVSGQVRASARLISDLAEMFPAVRISTRFYQHDPFLRLYTFANRESGRLGLVGLYYSAGPGRRLKGAESNELIICEQGSDFAGRLLERCQSRFDLAWVDLSVERAVQFDLDGVVIDSMPSYAAAWRSALSAHGCSVNNDDEFYMREGEEKKNTARLLYKRVKGVAPNEKLVSRIVADVETEYARSFQLRVVDGIKELLEELKLKGVGRSLVTGSSRKTFEFVRSHDAALFALFDVIVTADDTPAKKPSGDPYSCGASRLGMKSQSCVVVENAPLGVQSAKAAKMACLGLLLSSSPLSPEALLGKGAIAVARSIGELRRYLIFADANVPMQDLIEWISPGN